MFLAGNQRGVYTSKLKLLHTGCLHSIKLSIYKVGIKFNKGPLALEHNNYATKIVNAYNVYELDTWAKFPLNNFKLKNCLLGATNIVKHSDKEKLVYSGYEIAFDGAGSWNFGNGFAKNVVIFGIDNSSSSHAETRKSNILVLGEGPTYGINISFGSPEKKFSFSFSKESTKFCFSLHYNGDNSLFVNGKEIFKSKPIIKMLIFQLNFV